jgi:glycosyltransferase 2 family protein
VRRTLLLATVSLALGGLGVYVVGRDVLVDASAYRIDRPDPVLVAVAVGSLLTLWLVPALRLQFLARRHGHRLRAPTALMAHVIMVFGAALTPSGTGGAPTLVAALGRLGIPWGTAIGMAIQIFVLDLIVFAWLIPLSFIYVIVSQTLVLPPNLEAVGLGAAALALLLAIALVRWPLLVVRLMLGLARRTSLRRWEMRLRRNARSYYRSARTFAATGPRGWSWLLGITLLSWGASFTLFWALLALYGTGVPFLDLVAVLSPVTLVSFVIPTPGASGFMEIAAGLGTSAQAGSATVPPLVLWRLGSFYVTYALGPLASWLLLTAPPPTLQHGR